MRALLPLIAVLFAPSAYGDVERKGSPESPEQRAAFQAMYRREVEPILAQIEKSLPSKSIPELIAMLAEDSPMLANAKPGSYATFLPPKTSDTLYYLVSRDGNRVVFKELERRVTTDRNAFEEFADDRERNLRSIFTGSAGVPMRIQSLCKTLLETGKYR